MRPALSWAGDGFFAAIVDVESGVFPGEEVGEFAGADEFGVAEGVEEVVAEELIQGRPTALHPCGARHPLARVPVQNAYKPSAFFDGRSEVLIRPPRPAGSPAGSGFACVQNASDPSAFFTGHAVEAAVGGEESVGGQGMWRCGWIDEVVAEGVDGGDGADAAVG